MKNLMQALPKTNFSELLKTADNLIAEVKTLNQSLPDVTPNQIVLTTADVDKLERDVFDALVTAFR
jgi:hypothetical protein